MRQNRSNRATYASIALIVCGLLFVVFYPSSHDASNLARQRKSHAAAANPLSPPTSAFRKQSLQRPGQRVPPPVVHYHLDNLTATPTPLENSEKILILTPLARFFPEFWSNLLTLSYPHEHISLGFIIPKSREGNAATTALQSAIQETQSGPDEKRFQSITILRQDFAPPLQTQEEHERHKMENQKQRRAAMARARNSVLFTTIGPHTSWVLWLDGDIIETPPTLIEDLTKFDKSIIVPNCFQRFVNETGFPETRPYDYNSWIDSMVAEDLAIAMEPDEILLEGYESMPTYRTLMAGMADKAPEADPNLLMELDGVGGTALMVKAEVHRDGAMFPPFSFYHLIETEGFARMARRLGYESWGLPNYFVSVAACA